MTIRKNMLALAAAVAAMTTFGAANDALVTFSTKGPDRYADGTTVLDGETYALVWLPSGSSGATFAADGTVTGGKAVLFAPVAKNGRCPKIVFEVSASRLKNEFKGGSWAVYMLDTRKWGASGGVAPSGRASGVTAVNAANSIDGSAVALSEGSLSSALASKATASTVTAVPDGAPQPKVTAVKVDGGYVFVTVANTVPYLAYGLKEGASPDAVSASATVGDPMSGDADGEIVLVAPAKKGSGFFKVGRR